MTNIEYCSPTQCELLKASGFDWETDAYYTNEDAPEHHFWIVPDKTMNYNDGSAGLLTMSAPTLYYAAKWLREVHGADIVVSPRFDSNTGDRIGYFWRWSQRTDVKDENSYESFEDALSAGIDAVIEPFKILLQ